MSISRKMITRIAGTLCTVFLALFVLLPIYDFCSPWPAALQSLQQFGKSFRLCIGMSSVSFENNYAGQIVYTSTIQRTFALVPIPIGLPHVVTVSQDQDGHVTVDDTIVVFWIWLLAVAICAFGAWRLVVKRLLRLSPKVGQHGQRS